MTERENAMNRIIQSVAPLLGVLLLAACGTTGPEVTPEPAAAVTPTVPPLQSVAETCDLPDSAVGDEGATLILDGAGSDDRKIRDGDLVTVGDKLSTKEVGCALAGTEIPDSVISMMEGTRALDGRQTQDSDKYTYTWSYHPDNGLDVIITERA